MDTSSKRNKKPPRLPEAIAETLREQIISGKILPGQRIPNFDELASEYGVGRSTVKVAIKELQTDGFLKASVRIGTFVESRLPSQGRYGLVIRDFGRPHNQKSLLPHIALQRAVDYINQTSDIKIIVYHIPLDSLESEAYDQLLIDIKHRTLSGLIKSNWTSKEIREAIKTSKIPVVLTTSAAYFDVDLSDCLCSVRYDQAGMVRTSIKDLAENGIKRAALIDYCYAGGSLNDFKEAGLELHPDWCLNTHDSFEQAEVYVKLFFQVPPPHPEAIIVGDDHLIKFVVRAIDNLKLQESERPRLYCFCNYPEIPQVDYPVTFIGLNAYTMLGKTLDLLTKKCIPPENKNIVIENQIFPKLNRYESNITHSIYEYNAACSSKNMLKKSNLDKLVAE
jgi:DNA-binding transcriptional regulator YhcF (GntR family)/DNA-binding LacI/PurR family transcriptional regulator